MKTVEFESTINQSGQITLPQRVADQIPVGEQLKVVVMWEALDQGSDWHLAGRQAFESAYAPEDAIYESLVENDPGG